ncbi:hypothetical protein D1816_16165 [Aquimarina sp. AD10]|nr:hypothetical protein D1816_16165 [Aquimarina sp. AD10]RKN02623.1 hypothetical protein D7033_00290 [Aquimarina sp. AD10]
MIIGYRTRFESNNITDAVDNFDSYINSELKSLEGLENLISIGQDLIINENQMMNIDPLGNLIFVGNSIKISRCFSLTNVNGLQNLLQ